MFSLPDLIQSSLHAELASGNVNDPFEAIDDNAKTYAAAVEIFEHDATMNSDVRDQCQNDVYFI